MSEDHARDAIVDDWLDLRQRVMLQSGDAGTIAAILLLCEQVRLVANESTERGSDLEKIGGKIDTLARAIFQLSG